LGWLPAELLADGLGEIEELGALAEVGTGVRSRSTWTAALPVDGVLERPGGLLSEANVGVGIAGLQLVLEVGDGDPV
jgi:hypothetical protein